MSEQAANGVQHPAAGEPNIRRKPSMVPSSVPVALNRISRDLVGRPAHEIPLLLTEGLVWALRLGLAGLWEHDPARAVLRCRVLVGPFGEPVPAQGELDAAQTELGKLARGAHTVQVDGEKLLAEVLLMPETIPPKLGTVFVGVPLWDGEQPRRLLGLFLGRRLSVDEIALVELVARQAVTEMRRGADAVESSTDESESTAVNFIALLAHELRTPLTGLRGNIQLAEMAVRKGDYSRVPGRLDTSRRLIDTVVALVQNLQDMSRLERGIFTPTLVSANLTTTLWNAVQRAERTIVSDQHALMVQVPGPIIGWHDPHQIEQVFYNLLVNAVAYSPAGGVIQVRAERDGDGARVSITDPGIGIPPEEQASIFAPYYRGALGRQAQSKGLGLGLTISQSTVEHHGGVIDVQSRAGEGASFIVHLPLTPPRSAE